MSTIKPVDSKMLEKCLIETKVVTVEDHNVIGGLGSAVSECLSKINPTFVEPVGVKDTFGESGEQKN